MERARARLRRRLPRPLSPRDDATKLANRNVSADAITALTRTLFQERQAVSGEAPIANLIKAASTEKDAVYPLLWVGIMTYELPLSTDGSEKQNQIGPFMHVSKTTLNGSTMTTDWRATIENGNVEGKWIRRLSPDGKHMDLQIIAKASDGRNMDQTLVFKRK